MPDKIIELLGVSRAYRSLEGATHYALKDLNLSVLSGEFVAIMGPSGSGKTTLANLVGLLALPTSGEVQFLGKKLAGCSDEKLTELRRNYLGFIFQDYMLIEHMNAVENVMMALHLSHKSQRQIAKESEALLQRIGLGAHCKKYPRQLSGGQKQRVAIARALVKQPKLILADEPAGALDSKSRREILALLQELHQTNGSTIVMVTHNPEDAQAGTRLVKMSEGRVVEDTLVTQPTNFRLAV